MFASDSQSTETNRADTLVRVILWFPTENFTVANAYMTGQAVSDWQAPLDWNAVRVVRDSTWRVGYPGYVITAGTTNLLVPPVYPTWVSKRYVIRWPRTSSGSSTGALDPNKDILYMTILNPNAVDVIFDYNTKLTYIDP